MNQLKKIEFVKILLVKMYAAQKVLELSYKQIFINSFLLIAKIV